MANRLASSTSEYLLQHADQPVDWWPWCNEAFAEARQRDVPVLISVGYSACHWCHVMAHESFADPAVAAVINEATVAIKVDREERPDVDAVYMTATQLLTGHGGWPMTVFATPDGQPFYCGTYFPRNAFLQLVDAVTRAWQERREDVLQQGSAIVAALNGNVASPRTAMTAETLERAAGSLYREADLVRGGFGDAPKFPPHLSLLFLLRHHRRTGDRRALDVARVTCQRMACGGIYDQLAGGFARYSVDGDWIVPHFEKMLYDNALLLRVYVELWRLTGDPLARRVAAETATFLGEALRTPAGGFASALDADTDGTEGATYVWTPDQLRQVLGDEDGAWAAELFGVTEQGSFESGTSVLQLLRDPFEAGTHGDDDDSADGGGGGGGGSGDGGARGDVGEARFARVRGELLAARAARSQPNRDDKVVAAWNGLAVTALVEYAAVFDDERAGGWAIDAGNLLATVHLPDGRLRRVSRAGVAGAPAAVLDDHGAVAEGFCALHQYTGDGRWLRLAGGLLDDGLARFADGRGGFFDTADDAERLVSRPADPSDGATPSGLSTMAAALTAYSALTGQPRYRVAAEAALATVADVARRYGRFAGYACAVGEALLTGPCEVAVATTAGRGDELARVAWLHRPPGAVVVAGVPDADGVPLLAHRPMRDSASTAYVCRGFVCDAPVTTVDDLRAALDRATAVVDTV